MTIIKTMLLVGLFGLTMHMELYWIAGFVGAAFLIGVWLAKRAKRRAQEA